MKKYGKTIRGLPANYKTPAELAKLDDHEETLSDRLREEALAKESKEIVKKEQQPELEVAEITREYFISQWVDTNTFVPDESGKLRPAGTCLKLGPNIIYLKYLNKEQLEQLKGATLEAVNHELSKRQ